jgi:gliding motility-associated-like protein
MRKFYKISFFILLLLNTNANAKITIDSIVSVKKEHKTNDSPRLEKLLAISATITGGKTVCQNATGVVVTFTGSGGTAPYTFTYNINGAANIVTSPSTGNTITVTMPTGMPGNFIYNLVSVKDNTNTTQTLTSSTTFTVNAPPTQPLISANGITTFCEGGNVLITTSDISGLRYQWNLNGVNIPNATNPNYSAISSGNYSVSATNSNGCVSTSLPITVTVYPKIEPVLGATGSTTTATFQNLTYFTRCINNPTGIINIVNQTLNQNHVTSYTLNWGDSSPILNLTDFSTNQTHSYNQGFYTLSISLTTNQGCVYTKNYGIFVGNTPSGSLGNPGNLSGCSPKTIVFPIIAPADNVPGTQYIIDFGDGQTITYIHPNAPASVSHTYTVSSCGNNPTGSSIPNSFVASMTITNPCFPPALTTVGPIIISAPPTANFTIAPNQGCINSNINILNTSNPGSIIGQSGCVSPPSLYWSISPATGWTATGLGNNGGNPNDIDSWNNGVNAPSINFNTIGNYSITLYIGNSCDIKSITQTICIEAPPVPTFTLNNTVGCSPQSITATNTTVTTNSCTPTTYAWNVLFVPSSCGTSIGTIPSQTSRDASYNFTEPGTYTITLTATNSCSSFPSSQTVTIKKPPTVTINPIANICLTGSSTVINPTAIVPPCANSTYAWSFLGGSPATSTLAVPEPISYPTAGNYTVSLSVTNECGTTIATNRIFTINPLPAITGNLFSCVGFTSQLTGTATTATPFSWSSSNNAVATVSSTGLVTAVSGGTTTITYTNDNCKATEEFTVNPAPTITPIVSSTVCIGGTPTVLSFTVSGATGTPTYQWYSNNNTTGSGGTLIPSETNTTFNPPASVTGTFYYYCIITLPNGGCSSIKTNTATVVITPLVTISTEPLATQNICVGATIPASLTVATTGGTGIVSYQWYSNTTNSTTNATPVGTNSPTYSPSVFNTVGTFYYYVVVSASGSGCGTTTSAFSEVVVFADPSISIQPLVTQTQCQNVAATTLTMTATGGIGTFTYQWYRTVNPTNTGGNPVGTNVSSYTPPTNTVGTFYYYCEVSQTGLGCSVRSNTATIVVVNAPQITTEPQSQSVCGGTALAPLTVDFINGTGTATYQWYDDNGGKVGTNSATYTPTNTVTRGYYCIITFSAGGCSSINSKAATITINPQPTISLQPLATQNICIGGKISTPLSVTSSGGTGTPSYQWYSTTNNSSTGGTAISGAISSTYIPPVLTSAQTYNYYVNITYSSGGCSGVTSDLAKIVVLNDPIVTSPLAMQTVCQNSPASVLSVVASEGLGTYSYQWFSSVSNSNSGGILISRETNNTFTPPTTVVGTLYYYCMITQTGIGCEVTSPTAKVTVNLAPAFTTTLPSSTICLGQTPAALKIITNSDSLSPNYQWYSNITNLNSGGTQLLGETNATFNPPNSNVGTMFYYCLVTFPSITGSCSEIISNPAEVIINPNPVISNKTALICSDSAFTITPDTLSGAVIPIGTTYTWTNPTVSPSGSISGASAQAIPQTSISQNLINTTSSPATVTYTVTPLSGVCTGANFNIVVTVNPAISPNVTSTNSPCFGFNKGAIQTNIRGGIPFSSGIPYLISWTGPNGFTSSVANISNLAPGDYNLSIIDAGGCPIANTYTITEPAELNIATDVKKDVTCFNAADGEIKITITGGTLNYSYAWTKDGTAFASTEYLSNLSPGIYEVTVSDSNSCSPKTATFTITEPPILDVNLVAKTEVLCYGQATGAINVNVVGGTHPYTFAWSGPNGFTNSNQNLTAIFAGNYTLIVTDNLGCSKNLLVHITEIPEIKITATTTPILCYGGNDASIALTITGGITPYSIGWSNLGNGTFQDNLSSGDYLVTVTDANNCTKSLNVNIPEAPIFTVNPVVKNISCFGDNNGSIALNFVGGIAPITLNWNDGAVTGTTRNNLKPGSYTVTIIDGKPCTIKRTFIILEPQLLVVTANVTHALDCDNANSGAINLLVSGGSAPFTYAWSNGAVTEDLANISAGNYLVTVTDVNGCSKQAQYSINRPAPIVTNVITKTSFDCITKTVKQTFVANVSGGVPPYQLVWSSGTVSGANNENMTTSQNGTAILNVTDAVGCKSNTTFTVAIPELGTPSFSLSSFAYSTYGNYSINDPISFTNTASGDFISMIWDFGDGTSSTELNPVHTFNTPKDYVVTQTVTYPFGCVYFQKNTLVIEKGYVLVAPTAFTPNSDRLNDTFRPVSKGLKKMRLDIYDSWGSMIYSETGDVLTGWNGKIKNFNAENGNYYCKVSGETFYGTIVNENHPFVVLK